MFDSFPPWPVCRSTGTYANKVTTHTSVHRYGKRFARGNWKQRAIVVEIVGEATGSTFITSATPHEGRRPTKTWRSCAGNATTRGTGFFGPVAASPYNQLGNTNLASLSS